MALPPWLASNEISIVIAAALLAGVDPEQAACNSQARTTAFHAWFARLHQAGEDGKITIRWESLSGEELELLSQLDTDDDWSLKWAIKNRGWVERDSLCDWLHRQGYTEVEIPQWLRINNEIDSKEDIRSEDSKAGLDLPKKDQDEEANANDDLMKIASVIRRKYWSKYDPQSGDRPPKQEGIISDLMDTYGMNKHTARLVETIACPISRKKKGR